MQISAYCLYFCVDFEDDGVSIPSSYNSYLVPISAAKLYASIDDCKDKEKVDVILMIK